MSVRQINSKIVGYSVVKPEDKNKEEILKSNTEINPEINQEIDNNFVQKTEMNEKIERPSSLVGRTYKIEKSPFSEHALYVTINDIILDEGTEHEHHRPFEVFINSKNMEQFQWIVAMTRIISAIFRKGGDVTFLVEEMKAVFDPQGGYFRSGGYVPSLVAEIGQVIERHLQNIGMLEKTQLDDSARALINEKTALLKAKSDNLEKEKSTQEKQVEQNTQGDKNSNQNESQSNFPPNATLCNKCYQKSVVIMDGCATCLNCGNSKCG